MLEAFHGDSILIKTFDINSNEFIILIDGGSAQTFTYSLKNELKNISHIDLLILTHIDSDHIAGLIKFFKSSLIDRISIEEIWMNNSDLVEANNSVLISTSQGDHFKNLILEKKPNVRLTNVSTLDKTINRAGIKFSILSPTPEIVTKLYERWEFLSLQGEKKSKINISSETKVYTQSLEELSKIPFSPEKNINADIFNSSSISFLLECTDLSLLLLADSRPEVISKSIKGLGNNERKPLKVDYVKVSHHGSLNNTSQELLSLINCNQYLISTNGGSANHKHPSRECIARIVYNANRTEEELKIYFNYEITTIKNKIGDFINDNDMKYGNWSAKRKNKF